MTVVSGKASRIVTDLPAEVRSLLAERAPNDNLGRTKLKKLLDEMVQFNPSLLLAYGYGTPTAKIEVQTSSTMTLNVALAQFNNMPPEELRDFLGNVRRLKAGVTTTKKVNGNGNGHVVDV